MFKRMPTHCFDETCASCVVVDNLIFLAHHAGGFDQKNITHQMRAVFDRMQTTLHSVGATLNDLVQVNLYLKDLADFEGAIEVFTEYIGEGNFPARMTLTSEFLDDECLCMMDGVAYRADGKQDSGMKFSIADELLKWKSLLDSGVITKDEFEVAKKKLLEI